MFTTQESYNTTANKREKSIFSLHSKNTDEIRQQRVLTDDKIDRSCQRYLFESRFKDLEEGHAGDQVLSENSFFGIQNSISQQDFQIQNNLIESQSQKAKQMAKKQSTSGNYDEEEYDKVDSSKKIIPSPLEVPSQHSSKSQQVSDKHAQENSVRHGKSQGGISKIDPSSIDMEKSAVSISKNMSYASGRKSAKQSDIEDVEKREMDQYQCITKKNNGWIPEQVIYEKSEAEIKRMMTSALRNKQQDQAQINTKQRKSQQNFEKATNIINRLLNSSMNRMMRVRQHVHNFVMLLKLRYYSKNGENLTDKDYISINDLSIFHKMNKKKKSSNFIVRNFNQLFKFSSKIPIFMPTDSVRVIWDLFQVVFTYIFLYFYSILMFFAQDSSDSSFIKEFFFYAFFLFMADILINFNTAYFDKDIIINKRKQIAKQYIFSTLFITDCTSLMVLGTKVISQSSSIVYNPNHDILTYGFNILIFLKANGMSPKRKRFDYVFTLKENQKHVLKLINQLTSVITVAHIAAIGWYFIGIQENNNSYAISWLSKADLSSQIYYQKYIYSIYWSITTMTTVGYGDIAATNYVEALFISINMILFSCVFAYSINNIGFILQEIEKSSKQLNDNITTIQRYLNRKNVNISLKSRVRHYLSFLAQEQKDRDKDAEDQILSILSNKLRDEITIEINTKILNNYHIFSSNFSRATLNKLVFRMKEVLVSPNEVIFNDQENDDQSIYFIQSGIVEIYQHLISKQGKVNVIQTLTDGQLFGEMAFFSGLSRKASARSVNLSTLYKISRDDFIEILKENDEDFERFKMISEQIIFQGEISHLHIECYTCKQVGHIASQCPRTHQEFDRQFIVLRDKYSLFQDRGYSDRSEKTPKLNAQYKLKICFHRITLTKFQIFIQLNSHFVSKNKEICEQLKEDLQDLNTEIQQMFETDENVFGSSEYTESEEDDDEDNDDNSDSSSNSSEENKSQKSAKSGKSVMRSKKNSYQKKKSSKMFRRDNTKKTNQNTEPTEQGTPNLDSLSNNKTISNLMQENLELKKNSSKKINSSSKLKSVEIIDSGNSNVQPESSNNIPHINGIQSDFINNKQAQYRDSESLNSNITELQQMQMSSDLEQKKSNKNKKREKQHSKMQKQKTHGLLPSTEGDADQSPKSPGKRSNNNNFSYVYNINKCSSKNIDDHAFNSNAFSKQNIDNSTPQSPRSERISIAYQSISNSKKYFSQNSTKTINLDMNDYRYSIDQMMLQGLIANSIIQANRQSLRDQRLSKKSLGPNVKLAEIVEKSNIQANRSKNDIKRDSDISVSKKGSNRSIKDIKEERSAKNLSNLFPVSNTNIQNTPQTQPAKKLQTIQEQNENNETVEENVKFVERFSKLLLNPQLPLLLQQYTSGMSFREMQSINPMLTMDQFDKMQNFKKFFPHNNFDKVVNKLKIRQLEQKKLKKQKLTQKVRRQNILLAPNQTRVSIFYGNSGLLRLMPQEYNIELYKPTYLSYGVGMRKDVVYPINNFALNALN